MTGSPNVSYISVYQPSFAQLVQVLNSPLYYFFRHEVVKQPSSFANLSHVVAWFIDVRRVSVSVLR